MCGIRVIFDKTLRRVIDAKSIYINENLLFLHHLILLKRLAKFHHQLLNTRQTLEFYSRVSQNEKGKKRENEMNVLVIQHPTTFDNAVGIRYFTRLHSFSRLYTAHELNYWVLFFIPHNESREKIICVHIFIYSCTEGHVKNDTWFFFFPYSFLMLPLFLQSKSNNIFRYKIIKIYYPSPYSVVFFISGFWKIVSSFFLFFPFSSFFASSPFARTSHISRVLQMPIAESHAGSHTYIYIYIYGIYKKRSRIEHP